MKPVKLFNMAPLYDLRNDVHLSHFYYKTTWSVNGMTVKESDTPFNATFRFIMETPKFYTYKSFPVFIENFTIASDLDLLIL